MKPFHADRRYWVSAIAHEVLHAMGFVHLNPDLWTDAQQKAAMAGSDAMYQSYESNLHRSVPWYVDCLVKNFYHPRLNGVLTHTMVDGPTFNRMKKLTRHWQGGPPGWKEKQILRWKKKCPGP